MKQNAMLKNWSIIMDTYQLFKTPEQRKKRLWGNVYGHPKYADGTTVQTTSIQSVTDEGEYKIIETRNTLYKIFPDDIDPEYEKMLPNAYSKL